MVEKEIANRYLSILIFSALLFFTYSCNNADSYNEKVDEINKDFLLDKKELLTQSIISKIEDSLNSKQSIRKLNNLEQDYENKLNELNNLFLDQRVIAPFELRKTTEFELAEYGLEVNLNIKNRTVFNIILNKAINLLIKMFVLALIVFVITLFVNYSLPITLFKVLFSHPIILILFAVISWFISPAKYFGLIASDLENETEKVISFNIEKTENEIKEIKIFNIKATNK